MYEECRDESLRAGAARHDKRGQIEGGGGGGKYFYLIVLLKSILKKLYFHFVYT